MDITSLVFSPTGGTARVARALTAVWHDAHYTQIDLTKKEYPYEHISFDEDEVCYVSFPVYEGRVPSIVLERIRKMKSNNARMVIVAVYGNRAVDDALLEMKTEATAMGFRVVAAVGAVAEHSVLRQHATGRPDEHDLVELEQFGNLIQSRILSGDMTEIQVPGNYPYCVITTPGMKPTADDNCNQCGLCSAACPIGAIPADEPQKTDHELCIACMRCVSMCPQNARCYEKKRAEKIANKIARLFEGRKSNQLFL